jgi:chemotaxis protein CheD
MAIKDTKTEGAFIGDRPVTAEVGRMILVGLGNYHVSTEGGRILVSRSLGSAAALTLHDPKANVGGLLHWMVPDSSIDPERAARTPALFADQGIPTLLEAMLKKGAERKNLRAAIVGAASLPEGGAYDVGLRNRKFARVFLQENSIPLTKEETGGVMVRDLGLDIASGEVYVRSRSM